MIEPTSPPRPGTVWQHVAGSLHRVDACAAAEPGGEPTVVFTPLAEPGRARVRTLAGFLEPVAGRDGVARPRFVEIVLPGEAALRTACEAHGLPRDLVDSVVARYREPQRHYHAAWHVNDLFERARAAGRPLSRAQTLALLFHDAVYVAGAAPGVNESLSALLLEQAAGGLPGLSRAELGHACSMVRDTAGHRPGDAESRTVIALDLATLGDDPPRFDAWTEMVWLEYRHLFASESDPRGAFLSRRARVLDALLQQCRGLGELPGFGERFASNVARLAALVGSGDPGRGDQ